MTHDEILAIALKALKGGGGGGGTSNYNDLTNQPQINGVTLVGNKTSSDINVVDPSVISDNEFDATQVYAVGDIVVYNAKLYKFLVPHLANVPWDSTTVDEIDVMEIINSIPHAIRISQADYDLLPTAEKQDLSKIYYVYDAQASGGAVIDDNDIAPDKLWSSQKTNTMISQAGGAAIDDTTTAVNKVWSSSKTNTEISNLSQSVANALADKVDKVNGKGLSTEDYTTNEQTKLGGIESGAQVNVIEGITVNGSAVNPDVNKVVALTVATLVDGKIPASQIPTLSAQDVTDLEGLIDD